MTHHPLFGSITSSLIGNYPSLHADDPSTRARPRPPRCARSALRRPLSGSVTLSLSMLGVTAGLSLLGLGCGAEGPAAEPELGTVSQKGICNENDMQNVETYEEVDGVERAFIDRYQRPVGNFGCSGTLIGDGLFLTVAHCVSSGTVGAMVSFNNHQSADGTDLPVESYPVAAVLEDDGASQHALLRLWNNPEKRYGFTPIENRQVDAGETLVLIGHPFQSAHPTLPNGSNYKTVEVGQAHAVNENNITYRHLDTRGGASGSGLLSPESGRLVGVHRAGNDDGACPASEVANAGNQITRHLPVSAYLEDDRGSGHFFQLDNGAIAAPVSHLTGWGSGWHEIIPGHFDDDTLTDLFFYDGEAGTGRFYSVSSSGRLSAHGPLIEGLRSTWSQIIPIQLDPEGQTSLLFYDAQAGHGTFYDSDGAGGLVQLRRYTNWSKSWQLLTAGDLIASRPGPELVFYNRDNIALYGVSASGAITRIASHALPYEAHSLHIGLFNERTALGNDGNELLVRFGPQELMAAYQFASDGSMTELYQVSFPGADVTQVVAAEIDFTSPGTELLAYGPNGATGSLIRYSTTGGDIAFEGNAGVGRTSFGKLVVGDFWTTSGPGQALLYDRYVQ